MIAIHPYRVLGVKRRREIGAVMSSVSGRR